MSIEDKILHEIVKGIHSINTEFNTVKKLLSILDVEKLTEFESIVKLFSDFYMNRLTFDLKKDDNIIIDLPNDSVSSTVNTKPVMNDDDPAELQLKLAEEMRSIIDNRRELLIKNTDKPPVAPIQFRESVTDEVIVHDKPTSNLNMLLKLLENKSDEPLMAQPSIEDHEEVLSEEVLSEEVLSEEVLSEDHVEPSVPVVLDVMQKPFSHKIVLPPIPRVYNVPQVNFTSTDKLPESHPQIAPLFKLSLQQRNRMFEKFYKTAKLTVEGLTDENITEEEKNKMIRIECDKMLEDYLAGGVDTLEQIEL